MGSTLNDRLTQQIQNIDVGNYRMSASASSQHYVSKSAGIGIYNYASAKNLTANTPTTIGTLPVGYRPAKYSVSMFVWGTTQTTIELLTTGDIVVNCEASTSYPHVVIPFVLA